MFKLFKKIKDTVPPPEILNDKILRPKILILMEGKARWTVQDAAFFKNFMDSSTGKKLKIILDDSAITKRNALSPSASPTEICYQAGIADGIAIMIQKINSLKPVPQEEEGESESEDGGESSTD